MSILLIATQRDLGLLEASVERLEKNGGTKRSRGRINIKSHPSSERPKDFKSLLALLEKKKSQSIWTSLGFNYSDKMEVIFLQMSVEELLASISEAQESALSNRTKMELINKAFEVLCIHHPDVFLKNLLGMEIENQDMYNESAFMKWLSDNPEAAMAWYDQEGKAMPLWAEQMKYFEIAVINRLFESNPDEMRRRLEAMPPELRYEVFYGINGRVNTPEDAKAFLTLANELGFSSDQIDEIKESLIDSSSKEKLIEMFDAIELNSEKREKHLKLFINFESDRCLRSSRNLNELVQHYQWAESIAPGSGINSLKYAVGSFLDRMDSTKLDDAIDRVVELQSLITDVDLIMPLIESLNSNSLHDKAEALKARLNYQQ